MKHSTVTLVNCAVLTALICVLSPLSIPLPGGVPISLATFAVMVAGTLLGAKWGTMSVVLFLLLGSFGIPVFSGFSGGFSHIAGATGGYLIGYIPLAFISGLIYHKIAKKYSGGKKLVIMIAGMILGTAALYLIGTIWFVQVTKMSYPVAIGLCVTPFLIGDGIKIAVVTILVPRLEKALAHIFTTQTA